MDLSNAGHGIPNLPPEPQESATTKAGEWFAARLRGERLPEHLLPEEKDQ